MAEIRVLDKSVFNRIAAGEVVDRPCSIVKELVENSIDAGADNISIAIKGGGISYIRVSDNGKGIPYDEMKTAFLPHATSKIHEIGDLDGIVTLGFRGEALPSIASVAKVTTISRTKNNELGCRYVIDNGTEADFGAIGAPYGTSVTVENLFDRIPARKKFLAKETAEENAITNLVLRYILANNKIAFRYTVNDKIVYHTAGEGMKTAISTVYGDEYLSNMIYIHNTMSGITLDGYVNKPSYTKHSKSFQTLIINGRYVLNDEISYTVFGCYQKFLMKRQYPTYILYLNIPYDLVDVNVHPNKMEVKFAVPALIKRLVSDTIGSQVLEAVTAPKEIENVFPDSSSKYDYKIPSDLKSDIFEKNNVVFNIPVKHDAANREPASEYLKPQSQSFKVDSSELGEIPTFTIKSRFTEWSETKLREPAELSPVSESEHYKTETLSKQLKLDIPDSWRVIGKLFNTYIMIEKTDSFYLIDQHAAHEKLLYDRLMSEAEKGIIATQPLLIPYTFTVSHEEGELLNENIDSLKNSGFEIARSDKNPQTFSLKSVPLRCIGINAQSFISDFLKENAGTGKNMLPSAFREKLMQTACKSAVKGDDDLKDSEIECLLKQMSDDMKELFCPHGRPAAIKLSRYEIEKWFKRIV